MNILTSPKTMLLLDAGIEVLHEQSTEWLNEIAFWKDEAAFFYSLIVKKTLNSVPVKAGPMLEKIEKELVSITVEELNELQKVVEQHEEFLGQLVENNHLGEESYRASHKQLMNRLAEFEKRFKALKQDVFALAKLIDKNK